MLKEGEEAFLTATTGTGSGHVSLVDGVPSLSYPFSFVSVFFLWMLLSSLSLSLSYFLSSFLSFSPGLASSRICLFPFTLVYPMSPFTPVYWPQTAPLLISGNKRNIVVSWVSGHKRNTVEEWFSATSSVNVRTQTELSD